MIGASLGIVGLSVTAARADGPMPRYQGLHPLSPHQGAFCYVNVPHMHRVPPPDQRVYLVLKDGTNVFIGDPVALGYDGAKFAYYGPHPLAVAPDVPQTFCYISGPHYHASPQPPSPALVEKDGVTWYLGPLPPPADPGRIWINEVHAIAGYTPPKADLSMAPPGYHPFTSLVPSPVPAQPPTPAAPAKAKAPPAGKSKPATGSPPVAAPAKTPSTSPAAAPGGQP